MDLDERLRSAWQNQPVPDASLQQLQQQLQRYRLRLRLRRLTEALMTIATVAWFGWAAWQRAFAPAEWLLLPYFSAFLVITWSLNLRRDRAHRLAAESGQVYASLRLAQLGADLRELHLTRTSAHALVAYALAALLATILWGTPAWRVSATTLAVVSLVWFVGCELFVAERRRRCRREYRALRRLRGPRPRHDT